MADSTVRGLEGALSASRDGPDHGSGGGYRGQGRRRGRGGRRYDRPRGGAFEEEGGVFRYDYVMGKYPIWNATGWKSETAGDLLVRFNAKGEDNIVVALSPEPNVCKPMYEIVIGGWKDTKSVVRREAQGNEFALSNQTRLCSSTQYHTYWVTLRNGVVSVGVGSVPGKKVILGWKDPQPIPAQYVSFTSWDRTVRYKEVSVSACDEDMDMDEVELFDYVPEYLQKIQAERQRQRERAERFGTEFVEPSVEAIAQDILTPQELAQMRSHTRKTNETGFVTGFDPTTEAEQKKAEERAKRFGIEKKTEDEEDPMLARDKREARAKRFDIPVMEDVDVADGVLKDLIGLRVPRNDPSVEDQTRDGAIHIYGQFDQVYTQDLLTWFGEYGPSNVEWLHDCAVNVVFGDEISAKRALKGLARDLPPMPEHQEAIDDLKTKGYQCAPFPLLGNQGVRFFLVRKAAVSDVKADKESGYRSTKGYSRRGRGRRPRGGRSNAYNGSNGATTFDKIMKKRGRSDSDDEGSSRRRRDSLDSSDDDNAKRQRRAMSDDD
eukprot:CAMPEP_0203752338 /NCGR_PEP_ID=MMETSP0098-20131031/6270_1 /ASSEMBLY_ACC=CAM_ASM_000208 /TAXON_ID=96639 /ORGANISM=" , Strain NY0313808BC1" /LENGTH=547 /DNA_ID=CAMNT_0050642443 /DNA_START=172 /DNA_END=1815 /DNA_ORIENTATION=-